MADTPEPNPSKDPLLEAFEAEIDRVASTHDESLSRGQRNSAYLIAHALGAGLIAVLRAWDEEKKREAIPPTPQAPVDPRDNTSQEFVSR
jgi:hypothetical protein